MKFIKKIKTDIKMHKNGTLAGAIVGAGVARYVQVTNNDVLATVASAGKGLLDSLLSRGAYAGNIPAIKLYVTYIAVFSIIGYLMSVLFKKGKI